MLSRIVAIPIATINPFTKIGCGTVCIACIGKAPAKTESLNAVTPNTTVNQLSQE